jgi:DNA segregation ATPase FtsK/SpoIIIE, S-DNA-T family
LGAPYKMLNNDSPEGRAIFDGLEMQVAVAGGSDRADEQAEALRRLGSQLQRQRPGYSAEPIKVLPTDVERCRIEPVGRGSLGVSGVTLQTIQFPVTEGVFVIVGPMKSGKSSSLLACAEAARELDRYRPRFFVSPRRTPLSSHPIWTHATSSLEESNSFLNDFIAELQEAPSAIPPFVFIDDLHECHEGETGDLLKKLVQVLRDVPGCLVTASDALITRRASTYSALGDFKQGLLLAPDIANGDGDIFGITLPNTSVQVWPAGRGYIALRGHAELMQVGLPE